MTHGAPLSSLLRRAGIQPVSLSGADPKIVGASLDSRMIHSGDLFFAVKGFKIDGERFITDAVRRGAAAVVARSPRPAWLEPEIAWVQVEHERQAAALLSRECYGRPDEAMDLVGITATNGKTTVVYLFESIARAAGRKVGRIGTTGISFDGELVPSERTTPEAPEFYRLLRDMSRRNIDLVAMEVSSHALALCRVEGARFRVAAFLNISRDHLDFHASPQEYLDAKLSILRKLQPGSRAIVPADNQEAMAAAQASGATIFSFGRTADATVRVTQPHTSLEGGSAIFETPAGKIPVRTHLIGDFNLDNVAAAAACALALDLPADAIASGVAALESIPGRMERVVCGQHFEVLVDYAHTDDALANLLRTVRAMTPGKIHLVFGCGGDRDTGKRADMGRVAAQGADCLYLTSDNPRSEDPRQIADAVMAGIAEVPGSRERTLTRLDRRIAIECALDAALAGETVVIAGKGHETTQTVGERVLPFDDREVCRQILLHLDGPGRVHA